jgi:hypothetical protein
VYPFAGTGPQQITVEIGTGLYVEDECDGWYRVQILQDLNDTSMSRKDTVRALTRGVIPTTYVSEIVAYGDWEVQEIAQVLKEWLSLLKKFFYVNDPFLPPTHLSTRNVTWNNTVLSRIVFYYF